EREAKVFDYVRREFVWLEEPDPSVFSANEIDILTMVIEACEDYSAHELSEKTHEDEYWKELSNGEAMSVGAGSIIVGTASEKDIEWAKSIK
ncbi:MAG: type II toxin-antitoxin system antitoxin SocA domain-containing protein, partial [Pseudomonadota bacterium]